MKLHTLVLCVVLGHVNWAASENTNDPCNDSDECEAPQAAPPHALLQAKLDAQKVAVDSQDWPVDNEDNILLDLTWLSSYIPGLNGGFERVYGRLRTPSDAGEGFGVASPVPSISAIQNLVFFLALSLN